MVDKVKARAKVEEKENGERRRQHFVTTPDSEVSMTILWILVILANAWMLWDIRQRKRVVMTDLYRWNRRGF